MSDAEPTERVSSLTPMLVARDLGATLAFYRDLLGFTVRGTWPAEGEPTWCHVVHGGAELMFVTSEEAGFWSQPPKVSGVLYLHVDDLDALHTRLRDQAKILWGPEPTDYGMREFAIEDVNGYVLSFGEPLA